MKKTLSIMLMILMVVSMLPMALAEEDDSGNGTDSQEDTADDAGITEADELEEMQYPHGAEVRLLQLERAIARNILRGQEVIKHVENSTELESILAEMEELKTEVQNADPEAEDAVETYVALRQDASDLTKKFREAAREQLKDKVEQVRERVREVNETGLEEVEQKIRARLRAFNAERMRHLADILEISTGDLLEKIESGEITAKEARERMKTRLREMTKEDLRRTYAQLKEDRITQSVKAKARAQTARLKAIDNQETRLTARIDRLENAGKAIERIEQYREARLGNLEARRARLQAAGGEE